MNVEKSLDERVSQTTGLIRTYVEMVSRTADENRVGAWKLLERLGLAGSDLKEMDKETVTPILEKLDELLKPLDETLPLNKEDMRLLLEKLNTPVFQKRIRDSLSNIPSGE